MRPATTCWPGTGVASANSTSLGVGGEEAVLGEGNLPKRKAERGDIEVVLHAVAAHHDVAQCEAIAKAAGRCRSLSGSRGLK